MQVLETNLGLFGQRIPRVWSRRVKWGLWVDKFCWLHLFIILGGEMGSGPFRPYSGPLFPRSNRSCLYEFLTYLNRLQLDSVTCNQKILTKAAAFTLWTTVQFSLSIPQGACTSGWERASPWTLMLTKWARSREAAFFFFNVVNYFGQSLWLSSLTFRLYIIPLISYFDFNG